MESLFARKAQFRGENSRRKNLMRIQHNITALDAANRLKSNESTVAKNIQKLSSGYRINSAADDAAGLAVSEKMRKQINGLSQAGDNTKNGISLVQTAEGGLNETSSILQRMNTLAVESSNGTYKEADRQNLQMEVQSLKTEIDRISTSTKFNEISLLDGSLSATGTSSNVAVAVSDASGAVLSAIGATNEKAIFSGSLHTLTSSLTGVVATYTFTYLDANGAIQQRTIALRAKDNGTSNASIDYSLNGATFTHPVVTTAGVNALFTSNAVAIALTDAINYDPSGVGSAFTAETLDAETNIKLDSKIQGTNGAHLISITETEPGASATTEVFSRTPGTDVKYSVAFASAKLYDGTNLDMDTVFTVGGSKFAFVKGGTDTSKLGSDVYTVVTDGKSAVPSADDVKAMASLVQSKTGVKSDVDAGNSKMIDFANKKTEASGLIFQVGAENVQDQRAQLNVDNMNAASLGLTSLDISTQPGAQTAIDVISAASAKVSTARAQLGALQNELEHTANNLSTMSQNLTSAESTIRDVDMTDEYVQYSKNQILSQAANSMLAQANAQPQNVLSLLKG
jgi:flagellin